MNVKLSTEEMRYIAAFESLTGASACDCLVDSDENKLTFVVKSGDIGRAIGKGGSNIQRVRQAIGKNVEVIEHSDDPVEFLKNVFAPAKIESINLVVQEGKKIALVAVEKPSKGRAVGRRGRNIRRAKALAARHHGISDVSLT